MYVTHEDIEQLEKRLSDIRAREQHALDAASDADRAVGNARSQREAKLAELAEAQAVVSEREIEVQRLDRERAACEDRKAELNRAIERTEDERAHLERQLEALRNVIDRSRAELEQLSDALNERAAGEERAKVEAETAERRLSNLQAAINESDRYEYDAVERAAARHHAVDAIAAEREAAERELKDMQMEFERSQLAGEIERLRDAEVAAQRRRAEAEERLAALSGAASPAAAQPGVEPEPQPEPFSNERALAAAYEQEHPNVAAGEETDDSHVTVNMKMGSGPRGFSIFGIGAPKQKNDSGITPISLADRIGRTSTLPQE